MRVRHIDFTEAGSHAREPALGWLILALGVAALATCGYLHLMPKSMHHVRYLANETEPSATAGAVPTPAVRTNESSKKPDSRDKRWQKAMLELKLPWVETFADIENATRPPVLLISIKPEVAAGILTLEAEAPGFDDMLYYVSRLRKSESLTDVNILSHQEVAGMQGTTSLRFVVQTRWVKKS